MKTIVKLPRIRLGLFGHASRSGYIAGIVLRLNLKKFFSRVGQPAKSAGVEFKWNPVYRDLPPLRKIEFGHDIYLAMMSDPAFGSPVQLIRMLRTATYLLESSFYNYLSGGDEERRVMWIKSRRFDSVLRAVLQYLDSIAMGRKEIYDKLKIPIKKLSDHGTKRN